MRLGVVLHAGEVDHHAGLIPDHPAVVPRGNGDDIARTELEGRLDILIDGEESELGAGELIRVAPGVRRQLVNRGPGRLVLLALGGAGEHEGRDGEAFASWDDETPTSPQDLPLPPDLERSDLR